MFGILRLFFLSFFYDQLQSVSLFDVLHAFATGVRFDQIVVLAVLTPLVLTLPWFGKRSIVPGKISLGYLSVVFPLSFFLTLLDIRFYAMFDAHLNFHVFDYMTEGRTAWYLILTDPQFYYLLFAGILLSGTFITGLFAMRIRFKDFPQRTSWSHTIIWTLVALALSFLGIRGRVQLSPMDWGIAYFSQNRLVNQLALNPIYTLGKTLSEHDRDPRLSYMKPPERFEFVPYPTALADVQTMLIQPEDSLIEPALSLKRYTKQPTLSVKFQPNVVIVLMESWSGRNTGALGSSLNLTPRFDSLSRHGYLFTNFFASGTRTSYGLAATLGSFPSLPGRPVGKRYNARHPFKMISEILKERGYYNAFMYGGDLAFDNMEGFLRTKQYDLLIGEEDFDSDLSFSKWGVPDHLFFNQVVSQIASLPRPFQLTLLTLSNHEPFHLPDSSVQIYFDDNDTSKIYNCQRYADFALGTFIDQVKNLPVFDSTIFLFTADHTKYISARYVVDPLNFHIPLLIYAPALLGDSAVQIETFASQIDILPTLMGLLGKDYLHESWGRNLLTLDSSDSGYAIVNVLHRSGYINNDYFYMETYGGAHVLLDRHKLGQHDADITSQQTGKLKEIQQRLHNFLQLADQMTIPREHHDTEAQQN